jgi:hypothetical protein
VKQHGRGSPVPLLPRPGELDWLLSAPGPKALDG